MSCFSQAAKHIAVDNPARNQLVQNLASKNEVKKPVRKKKECTDSLPLRRSARHEDKVLGKVNNDYIHME